MEIVRRHKISAIHDYVGDFTTQSYSYNFVLNKKNAKKCAFPSKNSNYPLSLLLSILGLDISNGLKREIHISEIAFCTRSHLNFPF